jgi:hypothetical protein
MRRWLYVVVALIGLLVPTGLAAADTPTPTATPTATLTNEQRAALATIAPPPSCGSIFSPCNAMPWSVPTFPTMALPSPTIWPTFTPQPVTATPTASLSPTPSVTGATITPTAPLDFSAVETLVDQFNQAAATMQDIGTAPVELSGTPVSVGGLGSSLSTNVPNVFSAIKGVLSTTNNRAMGVLMFLFLMVLFAILVELSGLIFPVVMRLIEFILMIVRTIKP